MSDNHRLGNTIDANGIASLDVKTLKTYLDNHTDLVVIDVREPFELTICQLEDALHIPMNQIPHRLNEIPQDKPVVFMCHTGIRSYNVAAWLKTNQGYANVHNLTGGIHAWAVEIDPNMAVY